MPRRLPRRLQRGEEATPVEHLEELRQRLFLGLGTLFVGFVVAYVFYRHLIPLLARALPKDHRHLITLIISEPFMTAMWLSLFAGFLITLPVFLWQAWPFFIPEVDLAHERMLRLFTLTPRPCSPPALRSGTSSPSRRLRTSSRTTTSRSYRSRSGRAITSVGGQGAARDSGGIRTARVRRRPDADGHPHDRKRRKNRRIGYAVVAVIAVALPGVDPVTTVLAGIPLAALCECSRRAAVLLDRRSNRANAATLAGG